MGLNWLVAIVVILLIATWIVVRDEVFENVVGRLLARAKRTPYFHLHHGDDSLYMERYWIVPFASEKEGCYIATWRRPVVWLLQALGVSIRLHVIHTPDLDRAMHDHPWTFASWVLRGWYEEQRPLVANRADFVPIYEPLDTTEILAKYPRTHPSIAAIHHEEKQIGVMEPSTWACRKVGSFALRRFYHRHRISAVSPGGVVTLFISFSKRQSWGFYTPEGKVWWWKFESAHNTKPITARAPREITPDL